MSKLARVEQLVMVSQVQKRDSSIVNYDQERVVNAVSKAMDTHGEGSRKEAEFIARKVFSELKKVSRIAKNFIPSVESIQDIVERELIIEGYVKTAKGYILYREERAKKRKDVEEIPPKVRQLVQDSKSHFRNPLAEFVYYRTYSRWIEEENRRETWVETVDRYMSFMRENVKDKLSDEVYAEVREAIIRMEVMPSMRLMWSAGEAARNCNVTAFNCSYIAPTCFTDLAEILYILCASAGVGFSVEAQNVQEFPIVKPQTGKTLPDHVIEDSKEGWANSLKFGLETWYAGKDVKFDYSKIRPQGARLKTMGGRASGPEPLRSLLNFTRERILRKQRKRLSTLDMHDIITMIGDVVVSGGVRRSALISLSDLDDVEMQQCKEGHFYINAGHRSMANNSAVYIEKPSDLQFLQEWLALVKSQSGERGIFNRGSLLKQVPKRRVEYWRNAGFVEGNTILASIGCNPCVTGDTLVYVADGRGMVPIKTLAKSGKDVPVFCLDFNGKTSVRTMRNPRLTGASEAVYKVTLDDNSVIRATANHKFLLKNGEYKRVDDLRGGDSLSILTRYTGSLEEVLNKKGDRNGNYSGISNAELKRHALSLAKKLGVRFSLVDWRRYAKKTGLPIVVTGKWRKWQSLSDLAAWAAGQLGYKNIWENTRLQKRFRKYSDMGYNCEIKSSRLVFHKKCEICGEKFEGTQPEHSICGISCGLKAKWRDPDFKIQTKHKIKKAHTARRITLAKKQIKIYSKLKFKLDRDPQKIEWIRECKKLGVSNEISRKSSPFRYYGDLQEEAGFYNHKVKSVEFDGYAKVYNGTVDEFHNFFVGGFPGKTRSGKEKFVFLNNLNCGEINLVSKQFCNLTEVVCREDDTKESLLRKVHLATIVGTYQSSLTNFPYLSKEWAKNSKGERLLGVSLTGQWDCETVRSFEVLKELKEKAIETNKSYAVLLGVSASTAITCVKPSGTVSSLVDSAAGMHPRYAPYYIRRIRISASDPLFKMLKDQKVPFYPEVGQTLDSATTFVLEFPVKAPTSTNFRNSFSAVQQLDFWKMVKMAFTEHNPSTTISVGQDEWVEVLDWVKQNWERIGGLSFLPREDHVYKMAPYEEIDEATYTKMLEGFEHIDYSRIILYEKEDETQGNKELACSSGVCEI